MFRTFGEMREEYTRWRDYVVWTEQNLEAVMAQEDRFDDALVATFEDHRGLLGDPAVKAGLENVRLRKIVRRSVIPQREAWPEESWELIAHLMTSRELCNAGIVEYLASGAGRKVNVETLARWGFENALDAYHDAGYHGQHSTRLEDIPE